MANAPLLEMRNIKKDFFGNQVLTDINLKLGEGEVLGLVGENGAGKSTLMKILFGAADISATGGYGGEIFLNGQKVSFASPFEAIEAGIGMVHQEFSLIPGFDATENILLNREPKKGNLFAEVFGDRLDTLDRKDMDRRAEQAIDKIVGSGFITLHFLTDEQIPAGGALYKVGLVGLYACHSRQLSLAGLCHEARNIEQFYSIGYFKLEGDDHLLGLDIDKSQLQLIVNTGGNATNRIAVPCHDKLWFHHHFARYWVNVSIKAIFAYQHRTHGRVHKPLTDGTTIILGNNHVIAPHDFVKLRLENFNLSIVQDSGVQVVG